MLAKKLFALCREFPVAGAVPAAKLRFAPQRVNHSQNPQINEDTMGTIKKLVASFVGLNPAGPRSAMKLLSVLLAFILGATLWVGPTAAAEKKYVTDPSTGKVVTAPEYGGTMTFATMLEPPHGDPNLTLSAGHVISGVVERLVIPNWAVDRDEYALSSSYIPVEVAAGELAESWDISPDGLTYTLKVARKIFHDSPSPLF